MCVYVYVFTRCSSCSLALCPLTAAQQSDARDDAHHLGTGLIVFICLAVGVAACILACGVIYYNYRARHSPYSRWSARLHRNSDDVNFAQMIDSDWDDSDPFERPRRHDGDETTTKAATAGQRAHLQINGHHQIYRSVNA